MPLTRRSSALLRARGDLVITCVMSRGEMDALVTSHYREQLGLPGGRALVVSNDSDFIVHCAADCVLMRQTLKPREARFVRVEDVLDELAGVAGAALPSITAPALRRVPLLLLLLAGASDYVTRLANSDPLLALPPSWTVR